MKNLKLFIFQKIIKIIIYVFFFNYSAFGQISLTTNKIRLLDSIAIQDVPEQAPGIATAIIQNGTVIYEKYAGFANLTDNSIIKKDTRFNIASNGKQFTALAILMLVDEKKLELSDDIKKFFPDIFSNTKIKITIQMLLNHTSGIRDCYDLWALQGYTWWENSFGNQDVLNLIRKQQSLNFEPNSQYLYSNTNYILLALIVEKVSGQSFTEYTNEMFKKLNMLNTSFESNYTKIKGQIAKAYFNFNTWTTYDWIWNVCGDGNLFSTLEDQIRWEILVQNKGISQIKQYVILQTQQIIKHSKFKNYGYGLEFGKYKALDCIFHEGATGAWKATVIRFPNQKISAITLTNTGKAVPSNQTRQMIDIIFDLKSEKNYWLIKPEIVGKYISDEEIIGTYLTESNFAFQFQKIDNKIYLKRVGRNDVELEREANNIFHQKFDNDFKQEFTKNSKGDLEVTAYYTNHSPYKLVKQNADFSKFDFNSIEGIFENTETNTNIEINYKDDKMYDVKIGKNYITKGILISKTKMLVDFYIIDFDSKSSKKRIFYLSGDRIKKVKFVKKN